MVDLQELGELGIGEVVVNVDSEILDSTENLANDRR